MAFCFLKPGFSKRRGDMTNLRLALWKDKKKTGKEIHFVLLEGIGNARVVPISIDALKGVIDDLCQHR
jgi:3-dehydroquinate synthetase